MLKIYNLYAVSPSYGPYTIANDDEICWVLAQDQVEATAKWAEVFPDWSEMEAAGMGTPPPTVWEVNLLRKDVVAVDFEHDLAAWPDASSGEGSEYQEHMSELYKQRDLIERKIKALKP